MTEKGSKTLIGFFVMCALMLLIGGVIIVGSGSFSSTSRFVCFFDASLRGLLPGSPVYFRGVRVGKVLSIQINANAEELSFRTPVVIELEKSAVHSGSSGLGNIFSDGPSEDELLNELIRKGLRARLGTLSFVTGQLSVDLDMLPDAAPVQPFQMEPFDGIVQIPTVPSSLDEMLNRVTDVPIKDITHEMLKTLRGINAQLANLKLPQLSGALTDLSEKTTLLVEELTAQAQAFTEVRLQTIQTMERYEALAGQLEESAAVFSRVSESTAASFAATSRSAQKTMDSLRQLVQEDSAPVMEFSQTLKALRDAAAAIDNLATLLELKPDALIFGRQH